MTAKSWKTISVPLCYVSQPLPVCLRTQHFLFLFYILWRLTNQKVKHISSKQNPQQFKESFNPQIVFLAVLRVLHVILRYQDAPEVLLRGLWRPCTPSLAIITKQTKNKKFKGTDVEFQMSFHLRGECGHARFTKLPLCLNLQLFSSKNSSIVLTHIKNISTVS